MGGARRRGGAEGTRRRGAPPAGQRLDRAAVVAAARELIARDGDQRFTLRGLAAALDVRPAALYNHVRDRDDLLDAVVDDFVGAYALPAGDDPWPDWVRAVARDLRAHLGAHPHLAALALSRRAPGPARPALLRHFMRRLAHAGLDPALAHGAWHAVLHVVTGAASQESTSGRAQQDAFEVTLALLVAGLEEVAARRGVGTGAVRRGPSAGVAVQAQRGVAGAGQASLGAGAAAQGGSETLDAGLDALLRDHGVAEGADVASRAR